MTTISLCMMVKNEEAMLPRCLESVSGIADEIVLVDTGSTDKTVQIAEKYSAKVYHHPWENSFSKHRNQSLSYATGDWILIMDADEELEPGQMGKIRGLTRSTPSDVSQIYFLVRNIREEGISMVTHGLRLFRNGHGARYEGIVHNRIIVPEGKSIKSDIVLYHYGYGLSEEIMERKFLRTKALLEKQLSEDPEDMYALFNMSSLFVRREPRKAVEYGIRLLSVLKRKGEVPLFYINIFYILGSSYANLEDLDQAIAASLEALNLYPRYVDAYWVLTEAFFERKEYRKVIQYGEHFLEALDHYHKHREEMSDLFVYGYDHKGKILLRMGLSYLYVDDAPNAEKIFRTLADVEKDPSEVLQRALAHLESHHRDFKGLKDKVTNWLEDTKGPVQEGAPNNFYAGGARPLLSLCMMVKNEEKLLPRCLESVKDGVDEMIIVDTGSTDRTVEIAEEFGAKVYHHPWEDDFSKHRNQSMSYATGKWILIMDADETLKKGDAQGLREVIRREDIDTVAVAVVNFFSNGAGRSIANQIRLIRNRRGIHYTGIVHNRLTCYESTIFHPVTIYHRGYDLAPERMKEKSDRTCLLLKRRIEEDPEDYSARAHLAAGYAGCGMPADAIKEGVKAIEQADRRPGKGEDINLWAHFIVSSSFLNLRRFRNAEKYARKSIGLEPNHLDAWFVLAMTYHQLRDRDRFEVAAGEYMKLLDLLKSSPGRFGYMVNNTANESWRIHLARGDFYLDRGAMEKAGEAFSEAQAVAPDRSRCHESIAESFRAAGRRDLAEEHYNAALDENGHSIPALLGLARLQGINKDTNGYLETLERLINLAPDEPDLLSEVGVIALENGRFQEALLYLENAARKQPDDEHIQVNLAIACKHLGKLEKAMDHNLKALALNENSVEALINQGHIQFEREQYARAASLYTRAVALRPDATDVLLRLSFTQLLGGDAEGLLSSCNALLTLLDASVDTTLESLSDLAEVYSVIAFELDKKENKQLSKEAFEIAAGLKPSIRGWEGSMKENIQGMHSIQ